MKKNIKPYILVLPFLIIAVLIFGLGLVNGILQSLGYMPYLSMNTVTVKYYIEIFKNKDLIISLFYSIYISFIASVISVVLGILAAYAILGQNKENKLFSLLYRTPIILPHIAATVLVFNLFSQTGMVSRLAYKLNFIDDPNNWPLLVFDKWGIGIILVYLYKQIPFVAITVYSILKNINKTFIDTAQNLGANKTQVFVRVVLPLLTPTLLSVFLIIFAYSFGAFEVPFLLGSPVIDTLPVKAYNYYTNPDYTYRAHAMAINAIITVISLCFTVLYVKVFKYSAGTGEQDYI